MVLFCGPPGSGKTTLARSLESAGAGIRLCTDDWQHALGLDWSDTDLHERLQAVLFDHVLDLLRLGVDVIWEDGLWQRQERTAVFAAAHRAGAAIEWHVLPADPETLWRRLEARNARAGRGDFPVSRAELDAALELFEPPGADELAVVERSVVHHTGRASTAPDRPC